MKQSFSFITNILLVPFCLTLLSGCSNTDMNTENTPDASGSFLPASGDPDASGSPGTVSENLSGSVSSAGLADASPDPLSFPDAPTSRELAVMMGNGINLGNTFEAVSSGKNASVTTYECAWGSPLPPRR